jgi:DNA-binding SARP family transcriptional activator
VRLELFGGFRLMLGDVAVDVPYSGQRVLAYLALRSRPMQRVHVAGVLWPDSDEDAARASLRSALWRVPCRRLVVAGDQVQVTLDDGVAVDVRQLESAARQVLGGDGDLGASGTPDLGGTPGDLLADWYDDWVLVERERLRHLRLHALESLCDRLSRQGRYADAVAAGLDAVAIEPLRESAHRLLIEAHLREGNRWEALRQLRACEAVLRAELGVGCSPMVRALLDEVELPVTAG